MTQKERLMSLIRTRIRISAGGFVFVAETHPDAPLTVAAFAKLLPYRQKLIHVRWSGEGCWIPLGDYNFGLDYENNTSYPAPGQFILYPGGVSETEILVAYGPVRFASKAGQLSGNHSLTITENLDKLAELGRSTLQKGAQDIRFELA